MVFGAFGRSLGLEEMRWGPQGGIPTLGRWPSASQEEGARPHLPAPRFGAPAPRAVRHKLVRFQPPSLWHFVLAAGYQGQRDRFSVPSTICLQGRGPSPLTSQMRILGFLLILGAHSYRGRSQDSNPGPPRPQHPNFACNTCAGAAVTRLAKAHSPVGQQGYRCSLKGHPRALSPGTAARGHSPPRLPSASRPR